MKGFIWRRIRNLAGVDIRQRVRKALRKEGEKHVENRNKELENADDVRETRCVVIGGGQAGAMLSLLLSRSGVQVGRLESYGDIHRSFDRDAVHPAVMEILEEFGVAEHRGKLSQSELALTLPTLLVVPAGYSAVTDTVEPTALKSSAVQSKNEGNTKENLRFEPSADDTSGTAAPKTAAPQESKIMEDPDETREYPVRHKSLEEDDEEESQFELGRAQGRIELLEQELQRRDRELSELRGSP